MGIDRRHRAHGGQRSNKFNLSHLNSAKHEGRTLYEDVTDDLLDPWDDPDQPIAYSPSGDVISVEERVCSFLPSLYLNQNRNSRTNRCDLLEQVLYEMGILYDAPEEEEVLPLETAADMDWDVVSEVSELEWEVVSVDGQFSDEDSWG